MNVAAKGNDYFATLTAAINDIAEHGYDNADRVAYWSQKLREAAEQTLTPPYVMEQMLRDAMAAVYRRMVDNGQIAQFHSGVARFTLEKVKPQLRAELDRRIMASANLIKINREQAIAKTLQRFQGWATSIPKGGSDAVEKVETKQDIRKSLTQLPFEERRVLIDQSSKLNASLSEILATDGGAIAMIWHSRWRVPGYNFREDHKERDGKVYAMRENWAFERGLAKAGPSGYYDEITSVAEEPFCQCKGQWLYNLRDLPSDMVTAKGRTELEKVRTARAA